MRLPALLLGLTLLPAAAVAAGEAQPVTEAAPASGEHPQAGEEPTSVPAPAPEERPEAGEGRPPIAAAPVPGERSRPAGWRPVPAPAPAPEQHPEARATPLGIVLELHSDFGLEQVGQIEFSTGRRVGMHLNDGISAALGLSFLPLADGRLGTRLTAGYKVQYQRASNGTALFTAIPVELVEAIYAGPLRLGVGGSVLLEPRLEGSGFLENQSRRYDPVPGAVVELEWLVSARSRTGIGVRGTWSRFTVAGTRVARDGPAIGLVVRSDFVLVR